MWLYASRFCSPKTRRSICLLSAFFVHVYCANERHQQRHRTRRHAPIDSHASPSSACHLAFVSSHSRSIPTQHSNHVRICWLAALVRDRLHPNRRSARLRDDPERSRLAGTAIGVSSRQRGGGGKEEEENKERKGRHTLRTSRNGALTRVRGRGTHNRTWRKG